MAEHTFAELTDAIADYSDAKDAQIMEVVSALTDRVDAVEDATESEVTVDYAEVVTVNDVLGVNAVDVKAKIESVQSGSGIPSPTNIRPITGWDEVKVTRSGKNQFDGAWKDNYFVDKDGWKSGNIYTASENYIPVKGGVTYRFYNLNSGYWVFYNQYDKDKNYIGDNYSQIRAKRDFTLEQNTYYITFFIEKAETHDNFMLVESTQTSDYEPYKGNTYTISLNGTRYGGTLDVTTGELTVDRVYVKKTWGEYITIDSLTNVTRKYLTVTSYGLGKENSTKQLCNIAPYEVNYSADRVHFYVASTSNYSNIYMYLPTDTPSSTEIEVVYELATPQTIQLTPTQIKMLQGNNTLFSDTGDTQLTYYNSTIGNIGKVVVELENDKANKSDLASISITGTTNSTGSTISAGTYFYLNGTLVKAKADIANGATLTKNTNYEEVTAGALNDFAEVGTWLGYGNVRNITSQTPMSDLDNGIYSMLSSDSSIFDGFSKLVMVFKYGTNSGLQIAYKVRNNADVSANLAFRYCYDGTYFNWSIISATNQT